MATPASRSECPPMNLVADWIETEAPSSSGRWFSGVIDRLHVHDDGKRVEVIDFKTDAVDSMEILVDRYSGQMEVYRRVMSQLYPGARVECLLLSTKLRRTIRVESAT